MILISKNLLVNRLAFIDNFDNEVYNCIELSSLYVNRSHDLPRLVENLYKHVGKSPENGAKIYLFLIDQDTFPTYIERIIRDTVDKLYQNGCRDQANRI